MRRRLWGAGRVGVEVDPEDSAKLILGQRIIRGRGVGQGHLGGDQFLGVDVAQQEEQFGPTIKPAAHAVEHGSHVFTHHRPVRTATVKIYLARLRKQTMVAVGHDSHHLVREFALEQFQHRADVPGTLVSDRGPGGGWQLFDTDDDLIEFRPADYGFDTPGLDV